MIVTIIITFHLKLKLKTGILEMVAGRRRAGKSNPQPPRRGAVQAHNNADEAIEDAQVPQAELNDTAVGLDGCGESAGTAPPDGLLQRRLDKENAEKKAVKADKEKLIKEK